MNKNGIDDLLKVVSPELIAGYEVMNLGGKTLKSIYEEYDASQSGIKKYELSTVAAMAFAIISVFAVFAAFLFFGFDPLFAIVSALIVAVASMGLLFRPKFKKLMKYQLLRNDYHYILEDFKEAVEALSPFGGTIMMHSYTNDSVWGTLFLLAVRTLEAGSEFNVACSMKASITNVQKTIEWEQDCRKRFNDMFEASTKFGLDFTKARIYQAAQDEIDQRVAWKQ